MTRKQNGGAPKTKLASVEVVGLEGMSVTETARAVVESAGYKVTVRTIPAADLTYLKAEIGASRLPAAIIDDHTLQGMGEIREHFLSKK